MKKIGLLVVGTLIVGWIGTAQAATDEKKCIYGRAKAKGKYEMCVHKQLRKVFGSYDFLGLSKTLARCRIRYANTWTRLQGLTSSATCGGQPRYVDNANGTITDNLTGLVWEKKSDNGDVHDKDTLTTWSTGPDTHNGNGTVFTTFLRDGLNAGAGFVGANNWRLPTFAELQTILLPVPYPCTTSPCVDAAFNTGCVAGCTVLTCSCTEGDYARTWSATTHTDHHQQTDTVWVVFFTDGYVTAGSKWGNMHVRAVRGGL